MKIIGTFLLAAATAACVGPLAPANPITNLGGKIEAVGVEVGGLGAVVDASRTLTETRKANLKATLTKATSELDEARDLLSKAGDMPIPEERITGLIRSAETRVGAVKALLDQ